MIPQLLVLALSIIGIVRVVVLHGTPIERTKYRLTPISATLVMFGIFVWAGFFQNVFPVTKDHWPQALVFAITCARIGEYISDKDDPPKKYNAFASIPQVLFLQWVFYVGGMYNKLF